MLLTLVAASGASYLFAESILVSTVKEDLQYHADFRKERILTQFTEQKQWMEEVSEDTGFIGFAEDLFSSYVSGSENSLSYQNMQHRFRDEYQTLLRSQGIEDLFLFSPEGELTFSLRPIDSEMGELMTADGFFGETILSKLLEEVTAERVFSVSDFGKIELIEPSTVLMGIPLFSQYIGEENEIVGVLVRPFSLARIRQLLSSYSGLGETGEAVIAQRRNADPQLGVNFISHFRNDRQPDGPCLKLRREAFHLFGMYDPFNGDSGSGWRLDNACQPGYSVWAWIPELKVGHVGQAGP